MSRLAFAAILLVAAGLRLIGLGQMSLWMDEGFTLLVASAPWSKLASTGVTLDWHPLGSYIFAKLGLLLWGGEWGLRLPSALFGLLTVVAMYPLAKEVLVLRAGSLKPSETSWKPLAACALASCMAMLVLANRDGRSYSSAIFALTVATLAWSIAMRTEGAEQRRWWMLWTLCGLGAAYCHYYALVILAWEWGMAVKTWPRVRHWWLTVPLVLLAYLPALSRLRVQLSLPARGHPPPRWSDAIDVFFAQTVGFTLNFPTVWVWYGVAAFGLLAAGAPLLRSRPAVRRLAVVYWGFVATLVGVPLLSPVGVFETKYFVLASPIFVILLTESVFLLPWPRVSAVLWLGLLLLNLTSSLNAILWPEWHRQDFRSAAGVLARNVRSGDQVVLDPDWLEPVMKHYLGARSSELRWLPLTPQQSVRFEADRLDPEQRVWVVKAALAPRSSRVLSELSQQRRGLIRWRSHRRAPLFDVELFLFSHAGWSPTR